MQRLHLSRNKRFLTGITRTLHNLFILLRFSFLLQSSSRLRPTPIDRRELCLFVGTLPHTPFFILAGHFHNKLLHLLIVFEFCVLVFHVGMEQMLL